MKSRITDFIELFKNDTKTRILTIVGVVFAGALFYTLSEPPHTRQPQKRASIDRSSSGRANQEAYQDLMLRFKTQVTELQKRQEDQKQDIQGIRKDLADYDERTAAILSKILDKVSSQQVSSDGLSGGEIPIEPVPIGEDVVGQGRAPKPEGMESFGLAKARVAPPPKPEPIKVAHVGVGDSTRVELLAAVNAPTDGTPYPTLFKLTGPVYGPDGSQLPLGEARLVAAAQGSLSDSRVLFRLTDLSIRMPNGARQEFKVDGWIVGEDGIRGMSGILIDPIGKGVAAATGLGLVGGVARGFSDAQTTTFRSENGGLDTVVSGDIWTYGLGRGVQSGTSEWSRVLQQRIDQLIPHVQVYSGRNATAVFSQSFSIDGLYEALEDGENAFAALD